MPRFSKKSKERLATCNTDIQKVMNEAIKHMDFTVLEGHRSVKRQRELFEKGRQQVTTQHSRHPKWEIINQDEVVTHRLGS
jgi:hypothetical protein